MPSNSKELLPEPYVKRANSLEAAIRTGLAFPKADPRAAADAAAQILACYPSGRPQDPDTYTAAIIAVLAEYPPEIVHQVADPRSGIVRKVKFLPSIAELTAELEELMLPIRRRWADERRERLRASEPKPNEKNPEVVKAFEQLVADLAAGLKP